MAAPHTFLADENSKANERVLKSFVTDDFVRVYKDGDEKSVANYRPITSEFLITQSF